MRSRLPAGTLRLTFVCSSRPTRPGRPVAVQPMHADARAGPRALAAQGMPIDAGSRSWGRGQLDSATRCRRAAGRHARGHARAMGHARSRVSGPAPNRTARSQPNAVWRAAPMVDALIMGRRSGIDPELQDRFAQSGLVHLLSISGFHVGLITAGCSCYAELAGNGRARALCSPAPRASAYVAFLGWPAPATRAAALAVLLALLPDTSATGRGRPRSCRPPASAVLLVDPWAVLDLGGWLSAAALWGATTFSRWTDRTLGERPAGGPSARQSARLSPPRRSPPPRSAPWR